MKAGVPVNSPVLPGAPSTFVEEVLSGTARLCGLQKIGIAWSDLAVLSEKPQQQKLVGMLRMTWHARRQYPRFVLPRFCKLV